MFVDIADLLALNVLPCERYDEADFILLDGGMAYVMDLIEWRREQAADRVAQLGAHLDRADSLVLTGVYAVVGNRADYEVNATVSPDLATSGRAPPAFWCNRSRTAGNSSGVGDVRPHGPRHRDRVVLSATRR